MEALIIIAAIGGVVWWLARGHASQGTSAGQGDLPPPVRIPATPVRAAATSAAQAARRSATTGQSGRWVPLGAAVEVRGRELGGGIYVGTSLRGSGMSAVSDWRGIEPALVDPRLRTDDSRPDRLGATMDYWPAYAEMASGARAAYLDWLAAGRPAGAYIGYPFLFFAGIERRVLVDAQSDGAARAEVPALLGEVERLLHLYADNHSFRGYATGFLAVARIMYLTESIDEIEPPQERNGWQLPVEIQLVVGTMVEQGRPVPAEWALAWVRTHPEIWLRTPAQRCPNEFSELFVRRYRERHGEGLRVRRPQRRMTLSYRPASGSFGGPIEVTAANLPDISHSTAPTTKLAAIADEVTESLSAYSRYVGRTEDRDSLAAIALLPPELIEAHQSRDVTAMVQTLEERLGPASSAVVLVGELIASWPTSSTAKMAKKEAASLAKLLEARGYGLEPDARMSPLNLANHEHAVVWRLEAAEAAADVTTAFGAATAVLRLGVTLAQADGEVSPSELARLEHHLEHTLHLTAHERRRLGAHLQWLIAEPLGQAGLKRHLAELEPEQREAIGRLLIAVAAADGRLHPREMAALARAYKALGLDPSAVHSDLHTFAAGDEPVPILGPDPDLDDRAVPAPPVQADAAPQITLDRARIARVLRSTEEVGAVLTAVFADDAGELAPSDEPDPADDDEATIGGLDAAHSELVRRVATQPIWARAEFEALAEALGLMPDGAIEAVNDIAFEATGEPLLEGEEELEVNGHALKELLNA